MDTHVQDKSSREATTSEKRPEKLSWVEELEVNGTQLVERVKSLLQEANTRRVNLYTEDGKEIFSIPLTAGVAVGGLITLTLPMLAALGAVAALVTRVKLEVLREEEVPEKKN